MEDASALRDAVARHLSFLVNDHGFRVTQESDHLIELESESLTAQAIWDPRGEVVLKVRRRVSPAADDGYGTWSHLGMVGRADVDRLIELAAEQLVAEPAVLQADDSFFDALVVEQRRIAKEWTAYYSGDGPRPRRGKLP
jgi:hypothetical protein